ncbi:hypothetical protein PG991_000578 [Apiospora marii]|uniref:Uncharacterized protein n=1 Tax=Apiospora marii TaxID=335849 RepID=A0ABR1SSD5_9PEZI
MSQSTAPATESMESVADTTIAPAREADNEMARDGSHCCEQEAKPPNATELVAVRSWEPGLMANAPWAFISALLGTIVWFGACIGVVYAADRTRTTSWAIAPTVVLAILGPLGSMLLQYALSRGLAITWWKSALDGTTLGTLHRQWDHGTSVWAATTSGTHIDRDCLGKDHGAIGLRR